MQRTRKDLVAFSVACEKVKAADKQYADICDGDDFGLDAKNADNKKKKIVVATKIMLDARGQIRDDMDTHVNRPRSWTGRSPI
jgi:hypothetical protein